MLIVGHGKDLIKEYNRPLIGIRVDQIHLSAVYYSYQPQSKAFTGFQMEYDDGTKTEKAEIKINDKIVMHKRCKIHKGQNIKYIRFKIGA